MHYWVSSLLLLLMTANLYGQSNTAEPNAIELEEISQNGRYRITLSPVSTANQLRKIHQWRVYIETIDRVAVTNAHFEFDGRMPAHRHGLPTQPAFEGHIGDGIYLVGGVKFSMSGDWELKIDGTVEGESLYAVFKFTL